MMQQTRRRWFYPGMMSILIWLTLPHPIYGKNSPRVIDKPAFDMPLENTIDAGNLKLSWEPGTTTPDDRTLHYEVQRSSRRNFASVKTIYRGPDRATFISGLRNGNYYYRVRSQDPASGEFSEWSEFLTVKVEHHSLPLAFWLFAIGALVFLLTVAVVVHGTWKIARETA